MSHGPLVRASNDLTVWEPRRCLSWGPVGAQRELRQLCCSIKRSLCFFFEALSLESWDSKIFSWIQECIALQWGSVTKCSQTFVLVRRKICVYYMHTIHKVPPWTNKNIGFELQYFTHTHTHQKGVPPKTQNIYIYIDMSHRFDTCFLVQC